VADRPRSAARPTAPDRTAGHPLTPGTVIDLQAKEMDADATIAVGAAYGQHPVLQNFSLLTLFPFAREVEAVENENGWSATR